MLQREATLLSQQLSLCFGVPAEAFPKVSIKVSAALYPANYNLHLLFWVDEMNV